MNTTAIFTKDSYSVGIRIEEIQDERKRDWAREELSHLEDLYEALSHIDNMSIEIMFDDVESQPFLVINQIEIFSVTNSYRMEIASPPTKIKSHRKLNQVVDFVEGISSFLSMAA